MLISEIFLSSEAGPARVTFSGASIDASSNESGNEPTVSTLSGTVLTLYKHAFTDTSLSAMETFSTSLPFESIGTSCATNVFSSFDSFDVSTDADMIKALGRSADELEKAIDRERLNMIVTSSDIDQVIKDFSDIIADALNMTLLPGVYGAEWFKDAAR